MKWLPDLRIPFISKRNQATQSAPPTADHFVYAPDDGRRFNTRISRMEAMQYTPFNRATTLISSSLSDLMKEGNMWVEETASGNRVESPRAMRVLELLTRWPDTVGLQTGKQMIERLAMDYLIDGNAFLVIRRRPSDMSVGALVSMRSDNAHCRPMARTRGIIYELSDHYNVTGNWETVAARDVIHIRWPFRGENNQSSDLRFGFSPSPLDLLHNTIKGGLAADDHVRDWFMNGVKSKPFVNYSPPENRIFDKDQWDEVKAGTRAAAKEAMLVTQIANVGNIVGSPFDPVAADLREFQITEIARLYGVPAPLIGQKTTEWGSAIAELSRLYWQHCLRHHSGSFLDALSLALLPAGQMLKVKTTGLLRGDPAGIQAMIMAVQGDGQRPPLATLKESRDIAGLPPVPEGELPVTPHKATTGPDKNYDD